MSVFHANNSNLTNSDTSHRLGAEPYRTHD